SPGCWADGALLRRPTIAAAATAGRPDLHDPRVRLDEFAPAQPSPGGESPDAVRTGDPGDLPAGDAGLGLAPSDDLVSNWRDGGRDGDPHRLELSAGSGSRQPPGLGS